MRKRTVWLAMVWLLSIGCSQAVAATKVEAPLALYLELLGNGGLYSYNLDYRLAPVCSVRLGYVDWHASSFFSTEEKLTAFPVMVNYLRGEGNHLFEAGIGVLHGHFESTTSYGQVIDNYTFTTLTGSLAYRYQRLDGGPFFKVGLTPFYSLAREEKSYPEEAGFLPWFGLAFGYSF